MITYQMCVKVVNDSVEVISFDLKFKPLENVIHSKFFGSKLNTVRKTHTLLKFNKSIPLLNVFSMIRV